MEVYKANKLKGMDVPGLERLLCRVQREIVERNADDRVRWDWISARALKETLVCSALSAPMRSDGVAVMPPPVLVIGQVGQGVGRAKALGAQLGIVVWCVEACPCGGRVRVDRCGCRPADVRRYWSSRSMVERVRAAGLWHVERHGVPFGHGDPGLEWTAVQGWLGTTPRPTPGFEPATLGMFEAYPGWRGLSLGEQDHARTVAQWRARMMMVCGRKGGGVWPEDVAWAMLHGTPFRPW